MTPWATKETIRGMWADAPESDTRLDQLLAAAQEELEAYGPALADTDPVPGRYVEALAIQAKEVWEAAQRSGDIIGGDEYPIRVRPISDAARQLMRPRNPRARFGRKATT